MQQLSTNSFGAEPLFDAERRNASERFPPMENMKTVHRNESNNVLINFTDQYTIIRFLMSLQIGPGVFEGKVWIAELVQQLLYRRTVIQCGFTNCHHGLALITIRNSSFDTREAMTDFIDFEGLRLNPDPQNTFSLHPELAILSHSRASIIRIPDLSLPPYGTARR